MAVGQVPRVAFFTIILQEINEPSCFSRLLNKRGSSNIRYQKQAQRKEISMRKVQELQKKVTNTIIFSLRKCCSRALQSEILAANKDPLQS